MAPMCLMTGYVMNTTFAGLAAILCACLLAGCSASNQDGARIAKLQTQVDALSQQVQTLESAQRTNTSLGLQERCAADAIRDFKLMGWSASHVVGGATATFFSHYNKKIGHCLMVLQTTSTVSPFDATTVLFDANEQATYGSIDVAGNRVITCDIGPPGAASRRCSSPDVFDKYLVSYMGFTTR